MTTIDQSQNKELRLKTGFGCVFADFTIAGEQHRTTQSDSAECTVKLMAGLPEDDRPEANDQVEQHSDRAQ